MNGRLRKGRMYIHAHIQTYACVYDLRVCMHKLKLIARQRRIPRKYWRSYAKWTGIYICVYMYIYIYICYMGVVCVCTQTSHIKNIQFGIRILTAIKIISLSSDSRLFLNYGKQEGAGRCRSNWSAPTPLLFLVRGITRTKTRQLFVCDPWDCVVIENENNVFFLLFWTEDCSE